MGSKKKRNGRFTVSQARKREKKKIWKNSAKIHSEKFKT
jgi:hypothetical protein